MSDCEESVSYAFKRMEGVLEAHLRLTPDTLQVMNVPIMKIWAHIGKCNVIKWSLQCNLNLTIIDYGIYSVVDIAMALTKLEPGHHTVMMSHGTFS